MWFSADNKVNTVIRVRFIYILPTGKSKFKVKRRYLKKT